MRRVSIRPRPWLFVQLSAFVLAVGTQLQGAAALEVEFASRAVSRDILAIYDARHEATPAVSRIHRLAEMPLNWLGYKLTYRDVNGPLPPVSELERYRGIITWLVEPLAAPETYLKWLDAATASGVRLVCLSDLAPSESALANEAGRRVLERIGLNDTDQFVNVTLGAKPQTVDSEMIGFERPLDSLMPPFPVYQPSSAATRVHLSVNVSDIEGATSSALVVTSPGGGFASDAFTIFYDATADRARWILNPFLFFRRAFGGERFPVPDVTTLAGRRIYFSHIDGDGWKNISEIEGYREAQVSAAEVIRKEVIEPYGDLPVSVGLIAGDVDEHLGGSTTAAQSAAKIFALPQVEVASHTYTHPFAWGYYENYDRGAELDVVKAAAHPVLSIMDRVRDLIYRVAGRSEHSQARNQYIAGGGGDLPRAYLKEPFDLEKEVAGALEISGHLAPKGKKAALYLWSGDTEPFEAAIRATREAGVPNMNGGDSRFDGEFPSVFYVPPIARPVGNERQIYAGNSNENTYTNNWHGPYYGQKLLAETLKNTESPRRLKPFNLYYHMYSGEKAGALSALKDNLTLARSEPVIPVKASAYAEMANDYFAVELVQVDASSWNVSKRGTVQTFRFDDADDLDIDLGRSVGVLGATRTNGALYVSLDSDVAEANITLRGTGIGVDASRQLVRLLDSRWQVRALHRQDGCGFAFQAEGYGKGDMVWLTVPGHRFDIEVKNRASVLESLSAASDASGRLVLSLSPNAIEGVEIDLVCHDS